VGVVCIARRPVCIVIQDLNLAKMLNLDGDGAAEFLGRDGVFRDWQRRHRTGVVDDLYQDRAPSLFEQGSPFGLANARVGFPRGSCTAATQ